MNSTLTQKLTGFKQLGLVAALAAVASTGYAQVEVPGATLFSGACAACHGANGRGTPQAPSVVERVTRDDDEDLIAFLRAGSPEKGMPPAAVSNEQLPTLVAYLRTLATAAAAETAQAGVESSVVQNGTIDDFRPITEEELLHPNPGD